VISRVIDETGCGLLLDISHARIVASHLGMDAHEYMAALPVKRLREMHITGIQVFDQSWLDMMTNKGMPEHRFNLSENLGRWMDHLPITDQDWPEIAWVLEQIGNGSWAEPWVASCEYGGIGGGFFEATTDEAVIREQFPRLGKMVKGAFG
jgi:uncharacterized protein